MTEELIEVEGWKGEGTTEIIEEGDIICLRLWHQHKNTKEHYPEEHRFPRANVDNLLKIIRDNCTPQEEYKCYYLWRKLIQFYNLNDLSFMGIDKDELKKKIGHPEVVDKVLEEIAPIIIYESFDGKKLRRLAYFPLYYFPLVVLRKKGYLADLEKTIIYGGG